MVEVLYKSRDTYTYIHVQAHSHEIVAYKYVFWYECNFFLVVTILCCKF